jgi:hypothetical protein
MPRTANFSFVPQKPINYLFKNFIVDNFYIESALSCLHRVDNGSTVDVSEAVYTSETSATLPASKRRKYPRAE